MNDREVEYDSHVPSLIHFFGPDGSGKSAQARILVASLNRKSIRAKKVWLRAHHTLAFVLWKLLIRIGFYRSVSNSSGVMTRLPAVDRDKFLRGFWAIAEFIGVLPLILRAYAYMLRGYHLVAERYVLDTVTSIAYTINDFNFLRSRISKVLLRLVPEKTVFIFLDSNYEAIHKRRVTSSCHAEEGFPQSANNYLIDNSVEPRDFIEFQRTAYKVLADSFDALIIDTSNFSIEETSKIVLQYLEAPNRFL